MLVPFCHCRCFQMKAATSQYTWRKCLGVFCLLIEMNLIGGTIFGFPALYDVLPKYGVYEQYCDQSIAVNATITQEIGCSGQTEQYEVGHWYYPWFVVKDAS